MVAGQEAGSTPMDDFIIAGDVIADAVSVR
jgi:hypothetical protein